MLNDPGGYGNRRRDAGIGGRCRSWCLAAWSEGWSRQDHASLVVSSVIGESVVKGLISTAAGIVAAMIGIDPMEEMPRLDFGILDFQSGLALVPLLIGDSVFSEILLQVERTSRVRGNAKVITDLVLDGDRLP